MTAARQQRKSRLISAATIILYGIMTPQVLQAGAPEPRVVNAQTGVAISGFDPVAYFTESQPKFGRPDLELSQGGAVWRFRNEGNRAAFADHPEVYTPRYGGYDPVAVARGASVPGHPLFWVVLGERLYLFYDAKAREAFLAQPGRFIEAAERKWPEVARGIGR
jgi:hypothetical protein